MKIPPNMKDNCEFTEYAVMDSLQGVVLQLGGLGRRLTHTAIKSQHVTKCYTGPWTLTNPFE
jgi:hypothetical protein